MTEVVSESLQGRFIGEIARFYQTRLEQVDSKAIRDIRDTVQRVVMSAYQAGAKHYSLPYKPNMQAINAEIEAMTGQITAWLKVQQRNSRREVTRLKRPGQERKDAYKLVVGLTPRQARTVLLRNMDEKTAKQYRQVRATVIARTEASRWINAGLDMLFLDRLEDGTLTSGSKKVLRNSSFGNVCPVCKAVNGQEVGLLDPFETSLGAFATPPFHPHCRCFVELMS